MWLEISKKQVFRKMDIKHEGGGGGGGGGGGM